LRVLMTKDKERSGKNQSNQESSLIRLNKAIADTGLCSRRAADTLIAEGRVSIDGIRVSEVGTKVNPARHKIMVDDRALNAPVSMVTVVLHKPVGFLTSRRVQSRTQKSIYELLPGNLQAVDPVGRLDEDSSGLLILSTDGQLVNHLMHPRFHWPKVYVVGVSRHLEPEELETLREGITLEPEGKLAKMEIEALKKEDYPPQMTRRGSSSIGFYRMTLITGYKRQIRRSVDAVGARVFSLQRTEFGPLKLAKLALGQFRILGQKELNQLTKEQ